MTYNGTRVISIMSIVIVFSTVCMGMEETYFPTDLPALQWHEFSAVGFDQPIAGVIYNDQNAPCCGVSLGGVGTGCIDIDAHGVWGFSSIFNPLSPFTYVPHYRMPRKMPKPEPILGLSAGGKTWVLASNQFLNPTEVNWCSEPYYPGAWTPETKQQKVTPSLVRSVVPIQKIHYWGHFPIADMEFVTDSPVKVGMRAWSPFILGDSVSSNIPAAVFEVHLRNSTAESQSGTIAFNFPGPYDDEAKSSEFTRRRIEGSFNGIEVNSGKDVSYAIGVIGDEKVRAGKLFSKKGVHFPLLEQSKLNGIIT